MIRSVLVTSYVVLMAVTTSYGQRQVVDQSARWFTLTSNINVSKRLSVLGEGQFRYVNDFQPQQFQLRTGLDIAFGKNFSFMPFGYVYTWNPIYGNQPAAFSNNEHRLFQQVQFHLHIGRFYLNHRARLEQRFLETHTNNNGDVVNNGYSLYLNRVRYRLQLNVPLNNKEIIPGSIYVSIYNELFVDFGPNVINTDPDQNRFFAGAGYKITRQAAVHAGFFDQKLVKLSGTMQENNVGFLIVLFYNFDLTKTTTD